MDLFVRLLIRLGLISGKTLDKAINRMVALDAYLEEVEALEKAKAEKADEAISKALSNKTTANANAARAARIRERAQEFVS
jgi:L-fucose mutarotase/ribose pyranase (RbsD/FucU family)